MVERTGEKKGSGGDTREEGDRLGFGQEAARWRILRGKKGAGGCGHGHVRALFCLHTEEEEKARGWLGQWSWAWPNSAG